MNNVSDYVLVSIANGEATSGAIDLQGKKLVGISFPATMTGTTCTVTQSNNAAGTFNSVYDQFGNQVSIPVRNGYVPVDPAVFCGPAFIKVVSGSNEGAARTLYAVCIDI